MNPHREAPVRPLAVLALAVLAAHLLLLRVAPPPLSWSHVEPPAPMVRVQLALPPMATADPVPLTPPPPARRPTVAQPGTPRTAATQPELVIAPSMLTAPAAARWRYVALTLHRGVLLEGTASLDWKPVGGTYDAVLGIDVAGLPRREQRSTGEFADGEGLRPRRFSDRQRGEQATHFERDAGQVLFSANQPPVALLAGAQDRVSVLLQLLALARAEPSRMAPGAAIDVQVAGTRVAEPWRFVVERWEAIDLPAGPVRALKLTRSPAREYDLRMEVWLAPDYGPVRLRLTPPNGDWLDLQWSGTDKG
ncbi:DUF3108 domain-containing protein [Ramlibacter algicola]|uniref:DUF3108 domain-containing protein n=1 Tax=Ramlibacter algicola TaxID=2795217 RepID=A0A934UQ25_9BURK|nr:DUF3108 domain-containing protein [Ramlibacter algicola]MBK0391208.1 DUF3108 domain-containing protein [Ramlibacter algicola]